MKNAKAFEYFASANGYTGFRSYFDTVYKSENFDKIIILQGGPGSGKSSLMKKAATLAYERGLYHEILRCSSDINSLDGVIIEHESKRVAMLDGTAPHLRGQDIPWVVDEIFDTGKFFDLSMLKRQKNDIISLARSKSKEYSRAYSELAYSSFFDINIKAEIYNSFDKNKMLLLSKKIVADLEEQKSELRNRKNTVPKSKRLISSFSKNGDNILDTPLHYNMKTLGISGVYGEEFIFIDKLSKYLQSEGFSVIEFPTALDGKYSDCIICTDLSLCVTTLKCGELINASDFLSANFDKETARIEYLISKRDEFKNNAKAYLNRASENHFELEKIYTPCMDFDLMKKEAENIYEKLFSSLNI